MSIEILNGLDLTSFRDLSGKKGARPECISSSRSAQAIKICGGSETIGARCFSHEYAASSRVL
jgi:hypothetical protein